MTIKELSDQAIRKCKEYAARIEADYNRGFLTDKDARNERIKIASDAWDELKETCRKEEIDLNSGSDALYQAIFGSAGIHIKKVPVRYYPRVEKMTGSLCYIRGLENTESLFMDKEPIGKTFEFKTTFKMGDEQIPADYFFKIEKEDFEYGKKDASWEGWKCYEGQGRPEGYLWADASLFIREHEGTLQSVALQKTYSDESDPIWKKRAAHPVEDYWWIGINEEIPEDLEIPEGEFYYDETKDERAIE